MNQSEKSYSLRQVAMIGGAPLFSLLPPGPPPVEVIVEKTELAPALDLLVIPVLPAPPAPTVIG